MEFEVSEISELVTAWMAAEGLNLLRNVLVFLSILVVGYLFAKLARRSITSALGRSKLHPSPLFKEFAGNVASKAVWIMAFIVALGNLGVDTGALIAGLGVSGLVIGFALQDTLSNFASGMLILLYQPFDVGHFVEIGDTVGTVDDMTLVSTILKTPDNKLVTIPNSRVWGRAITNFTASGTRRIDLVVGVAYDTDIDEVRDVFFDLLEDNESVLEDPEPIVWVGELGNSSIDFFVRGWVKTDEFWPTRSELLRQVKYHLDSAEIGIPFPQREVWMHEMDE